MAIRSKKEEADVFNLLKIGLNRKPVRLEKTINCQKNRLKFIIKR